MTIPKKIKAIIIGEITLPKIIPNFDHILLSGKRYFELNIPKIKKIIAKIKDHILISSLFKSG